jgi:photosystem II stability/assembly factor-like uncharacterized protein
MRVSPTQRLYLLSIVAVAATLAWAQLPVGQAPAPAPPPPNPSADPLLRGFSFRSIGPANMMGRVDDIQGADRDPMIVYAGFATGGLWKSTDGGNHWTSQFDNLPNESIGSIAIAPSNPDVVYVGMGEANNRQSSSIGDGVWGTPDGGKTWNHLGLEETQSIGRVVVDPVNPNIVYVAAMGHLFGPNPERGLYKSVDGGKNWARIKFIDNNTGFTDVAIDPANPKILYAASYQRLRTWWGYNGGGPGSALWKSTDAGANWTRLEGPGWAKPKDGLLGRIAIAIFRAKPSIIYAQVEAGASGGVGSGTGDNGLRQVGRGGAGATESGGESAASTTGTAPATGPAPGGPGGGRNPLGNTPPDPATGIYRSEDGGKTWTQVSHLDDRPMYFSQIRVDPVNDKKLFVGGNPARMSLDAGKTWTNITASHTDYHAFWIDPKEPRIVFVGHDGGIDVSHDGGHTWDFHNNLAVGQFYQVSADNRRPYWVCGGLQDNNAWCGPSALRASNGPVNSDWFAVAGGDGFYTRQDPADWAIVYAESQDGSATRHDLRNGTQKSIQPTLGRGARGNAGAAGPAAAPPSAETNPAPAGSGPAAAGGRGEGFGGGRGGPPNVLNAPPNVEPFRFYWNAPIEISPHNPNVIYMAAQYFFKSRNRGDTWWMNPKDLSKNIDRWAPDMPIMGVNGDKPMLSKHDGYAASSTATQVRESPSKPGVIWIGFEDGNLQVSQDGGETFASVYQNIGADAPKGYTHISRIEPSHFDPATAYVAIDNHRYDDWKPYLFKTTDYGKTWTNVSANLPYKGNINALREDYDNPNLLFVGTEFGLYVTVDGCKEFKKFMTGLPSVRIDDILIHPRDRDLIVATHGRSIWISDDITALEQWKPSATITLFDPRPAVLWKSDLSAGRNPTNRDFVGQNPQGGAAFSVWAKEDMGLAKFEILQNNAVVATYDRVQQGVLQTGTTGDALVIKAGMNRFQWNMRGPAPAPAANAPAGGRGGGGRGRGAAAGVPFVSAGRGGFGAAQGSLLDPGTYVVRLTVPGNAWTTSVTILEDIWMRPQ